MKYIERVCQQCGKTFAAPEKQEDRKFCGRECFYASMRSPEKRCAACGRLFKAKENKIRCCSRSCAAVLKIQEGKVRAKEPAKMVPRVCKQCGNTFLVEKRSTRVLCSEKCRSLRFRDIYGSSLPREPRACLKCGKEFMPRHRDQKFCGDACARQARSRGTEKAPMVEIEITEDIPVYKHLRPKTGQVYLAEDHRVYGAPFFIIPDICGKRIVVREGECRVVGE